MTKKIIYPIIATILALGVFSCNSDSETSGVYSVSNVAITAFSLTDNDDVLPGLDSVYFSIDLKTAQIYNADSLPKGTDISRMVVNISTSNASAVELVIPRKNQSDTTVNYLLNTTDSVDFNNGPVTIRLTAADLITTRDYKVRINVHNASPDSLYWNRLSRQYIPSTLDMTKQKTVQSGGLTYCLTTDGSEYCVMTTDNLASNKWKVIIPEFSFSPDIYSFSATDNLLYILDVDGNLYSSVDAKQWDGCNQQWHHIYGGYENTLLGVQKTADGYCFVTEPSSETTAISASFPVSGTSQLLTFETSWSNKPQSVMIGGVTADGRKVSDTWAYDGTNWAKINAHAPIAGMSDMTLVAYYTFETDSTSWRTSKYPTLLAMCGRNEGNQVEKTVYISRDQGMHWKKGDQYLQLPDYIQAMDKAQAFVESQTEYSRAATGWTSFPSLHLPEWWTVENQYMSRATTPVEQWQCPYIYLFGGEDEQGNTTLFLWRGVINRLTFKPII